MRRAQNESLSAARFTPLFLCGDKGLDVSHEQPLGNPASRTPGDTASLSLKPWTFVLPLRLAELGLVSLLGRRAQTLLATFSPILHTRWCLQTFIKESLLSQPHTKTNFESNHSAMLFNRRGPPWMSR